MEQNDQIQGKIPLDLKAVLTIFNADLELQIETLPHVKIHAGEIDWPSIFKNDFGSGHRAAIVWAKSLWTCHGPSRVDAFDRAFAMDNHLRQAVVQAISIRWGLSN